MERTRTKRSAASHQTSQLLNANENARVHNKLLRKQQALQTAVVQLVRGSRASWIKENTGALVIIKDSTRRSYYLSLYSIGTDSGGPIWEQEIYSNFNIKKSRPFFLQFSGTDDQMGINFAADHEADKAYRLIQEKASKRTSSSKRVNGGLQVKPLTGNENYSPAMRNPHTSNMGNMNQHMTSSNTSIDSGFGTNDKKTKTKGKGRLTAADISGPDTSTFKHLRGVQIGPMGQMTQIGNTNKNDPQMQDIKSLLQDMKIAQNEQQAEAMLNDPQQSESIYQFIEQRGGVNEVKRAYRQESTRPPRQPMKQSAPPAYFNKDPPPIQVRRETHGLPPPPPSRNLSSSRPPPAPVRRESINTGTMGRPAKYNNFPAPPGKTPPPPPSRPKGNLPPPPPEMRSNNYAPAGKPRGPPPALPPALPGMPPPPPMSHQGGPSRPPPPVAKPSGPPPPHFGRFGPPPPPNKPAPPAAGPPPPGPPPPSKPMSSSKPAASGGGDARNALLDQIRVAGSNKSGLKSVSENTSRENTPRQSISEESGRGLGLADQLAQQLSKIRTKVVSDDEDDPDGADSDEWDDSD